MSAAPVVTTARGRLRGRDLGGVVAFLGIPYAAAPEGPLRFQPPQPPPGWDGIRAADRFGAAPPQLAPAPGAPAAWRPGDGLDCLTVNVWSPDVAAAGLPVLVWLYGGLWKHGAASMPQYDGAELARGGVVVVTLNYRVGFEGFGHLPGVPDNRGLRDQLAALRWVRDGIAAFGGDPAAVTVFGQSAGAGSAALLLAAPAARGLFRRVIVQSPPAGVRSRDGAAAVTATLARAAGVEATRDGFAALPPEAILAVQDAPLRGAGAGLTAFAPVVDGELVTGSAPEALAGGSGRDVELLCGVIDQEYLGQGPPPPAGFDLAEVATAVGLPAAAAAEYRRGFPGASEEELFTTMVSDVLVRMPALRIADAHVAAGGRCWMYDLTWRSPMLGAAHGLDVPLVFGTTGSRFAGRYLGSPPPPAALRLSERMRRAWLAFATTGDPGWPRYEPDRRTGRLWDDPPGDVDDLLGTSRQIFDTAATA